jgi:hypothetical protein
MCRLCKEVQLQKVFAQFPEGIVINNYKFPYIRYMPSALVWLQGALSAAQNVVPPHDNETIRFFYGQSFYIAPRYPHSSATTWQLPDSNAADLTFQNYLIVFYGDTNRWQFLILGPLGPCFAFVRQRNII